jgi:peptidoglycan hydrolase CwlO-like protein
LQRIEITRLDGDLSGNYRTDGWDAFVSRSLSGYAPDLGPDLERLQSFEDQLTQQQKVLTERFQSLKQEQARFRREQAEIERRRTLANNAAAAANQQGQSPQAQSNPAQNPQAPNQQQPVGAPTPNSATTGGAP